MEDEIDVEVCALSDKKLSIRVNDTEVFILPNRWECTARELKNAMQAVADETIRLLEEDQTGEEIEDDW